MSWLDEAIIFGGDKYYRLVRGHTLHNSECIHIVGVVLSSFLDGLFDAAPGTGEQTAQTALGALVFIELVLAYLSDGDEGRVDDHDRCLSIEEDADCAHTPAPRNHPLESGPHDIDQGPDLLFFPDPERYVHVGTVPTPQEVEPADPVIVRKVVHVAFALQPVG